MFEFKANLSKYLPGTTRAFCGCNLSPTFPGGSVSGYCPGTGGRTVEPFTNGITGGGVGFTHGIELVAVALVDAGVTMGCAVATTDVVDDKLSDVVGCGVGVIDATDDGKTAGELNGDCTAI